MKVREKILNDIKEAMKQKDEFTRDSLRNLNAALKQVEIDERIELDDERIYTILTSEIKKRKEAAELYLQGKREDLAQKEIKEIKILENYMPKQLSDEELKSGLIKLLDELNIHSLKDLGIAMKEAKQRFKASVDGKRLNEMLRTLLK
ncbi:GatB/YqeY domain-containing protein [Campylobacter sp. MIT 21-1685]|uniref:GatB/YqeY domain-containing protein n=1 Tax=unclassified Campylobacter TaxID=2593542 RepID=UPI00224B274D|nr:MULTISPECIES: GatB/YqeY domain-containing protein [unclassified Campylobacter]MCX2682921.1 GatB/YqeY domain-containing protein [Campylobacter sp. MIT 21-1684]MCX2751131.1 GatB/YqeY domain-containing protein [Campylobacter sp. MIT 21-1682]MCX2807402.1 GatB/YqeY domain-containing protein [Campylobacter sp. MIT 21-1685]